MVKKLFWVVVVLAMTTGIVYANEVENSVETQEQDSMVLTPEGVKDYLAATDAMAEKFGLRYDIEQFDDGSVNQITIRGGVYLGLRAGFEYNYIFGSKTNYPAWVGELGIGYRTKRMDFRAYAGIARAEYGNYSDRQGMYISPRLSLEFLYEVAALGEFEENLIKVGAGVNYHLRRAYVVDKDYMFSFVGSYPGVEIIPFEYERQFWGSRSSLTLGLYIGTDYECGNGKAAFGVTGGVHFSYRLGVQKKTVYKAANDAK